MIRVDLASIQMNTGVADGNAALWYVTEIEGWDSPAMRQSVSNPTSRHGGVIAESLYGPRSVVLKGLCKAPNESAFWLSYNNLLAAVGNPAVDVFLVVYETTSKRLSVRRGGEPRLTFIGKGSFAFEVPLIAMNPVKLSTTESSAPVGSVTNNGNFNTFPIIVTTSTGKPSFSNPTFGAGAVLHFTQSIASGTSIDFSKRTVEPSGYEWVVPSSTWWELVPGINSLSISGVTATIYYRDAWI